jgi:hypothetical protein
VTGVFAARYGDPETSARGRRSMVIHGDRVCFHWHPNDFTWDLPPLPDLQHGAVVLCGKCAAPGILPVPGHEAYYLPPQAELQADGAVIWRHEG